MQKLQLGPQTPTPSGEDFKSSMTGEHKQTLSVTHEKEIHISGFWLAHPH